jgi:cobyrinic acid a,c-diamide synthase
VGKTTVATGLMAALRRQGTAVAAAKVGPDFIDPGYHQAATGRPGRNLDAWMSGPEALGALAARAGEGAEVLVVEGVMGLFDGAADAGPGGLGSTAEVARRLDAPVVLVLDTRGLSHSVAALVHGYRSFDPSLRLGGVVLNRVGSDAHEAMLRESLAGTGLPVLGVLRRDDALTWRERHLGLVPVVEEAAAVEASIGRLADRVARGCDLDALVALARSAPPVVVSDLPVPRPVGRARLGVAAGAAFSFVYPDNLEALAAAGAELLPFDPCREPALPAGVSGLVVGGGFPEVFAADLADNRPLLADLARRVADGLVVWAECGGLLWLCRSLDGHRLAGVVPADAAMTERLHLGYRRARAAVASPLGPAGTELAGHEFHYSTVEPGGEALWLRSRFSERAEGFAGARLLASYLHLHLATRPDLAESFVAAAVAAAAAGGAPGEAAATS